MQLVDKDKLMNKRRHLCTRNGAHGLICVTWHDISMAEVFDLEAFEKEAYDRGYKACYEICNKEEEGA